MSFEKFNPYGLRDGKIVYVEELDKEKEYGLRCNCKCPCCGEPLVARIKGTKREKHFAHYSGSDCVGGYESAIHILAKEILEDGTSIKLPPVISDYANVGYIVINGEIKFKSVLSDGLLFTPEAGKTKVEEQLGEIRPDVLIEKDGRKLIVEILVTHAVDEKKKHIIQDLGISCIEIDFSFYKDMCLDKDMMAEAFLGKDKNVTTKWIYNIKKEEQDSVIKTCLPDCMIFNPLNNSYRIGTRVSDLGFKHMVLNRSTVLNCPLRKKYYPNKYKASFSDCCNCSWNRGLLSELNSDGSTFVLCAKGDNNVKVIVDDVCTWIIRMSESCIIPDTNERCISRINSYCEQIKQFLSNQKVENSKQTAEKILLRRFEEKRKNEEKQRVEDEKQKRDKQYRILYRKIYAELNSLIFWASSSYDDWYIWAYNKCKNRLLTSMELSCLTEDEKINVFCKKTKEIWDGHRKEGERLYKEDAYFKQVVLDLTNNNPKMENEKLSLYLRRLMKSLKRVKGGYKKYKVSEPVKYLFISICPFLEFLMEKSSGLVEESEEL